MMKLKLDALKVQSFVPLSTDHRSHLLGGGDKGDNTQIPWSGGSGGCCGGIICIDDAPK